MGMSMIVGLGLSTEDVPSAEENKLTAEWLMKEWNLGPEDASADPKANPEYWSRMAEVWNIEEEKARRRLCANCEYFDDRPSTLKKLETIPFNDMDADGGGRGFCKKFDFICHNLRTCQAWESTWDEDNEQEGMDD